MLESINIYKSDGLVLFFYIARISTIKTRVQKAKRTIISLYMHNEITIILNCIQPCALNFTSMQMK